MTSDIAHGPEWLDWLAGRLGTRQWVVAPRLTDRLRSKGYTLAVSQKRYSELADEYAKERAS
jgi:hypothetical protein